MAARPASPDDYHSAREPSDFEYESDDPPELDPGPTDSEYEDDEGAAFSSYSSAGSAAQGYETDHTEQEQYGQSGQETVEAKAEREPDKPSHQC